MNIYEKINNVKMELLESKLSKSGRNQHAKFEYFQLEDINPIVTPLCAKHGLHTQISFTKDEAILIITDIEKTESQLTFTSPMKEISIPGSNAIQSLGGIETYQRRYLFLTAFDIVAPDLFDETAGSLANKELMISTDQRKWLEENVNVEKMLEVLKITSLSQLTAANAQSIIDKKIKQLEA